MPIVAPFAGLATLTVVLWVIAFALLIAVIMGYVSGVIHGLPYPVNQLAGPVNSMAKGLTNACWFAVRHAESLVAAGWHLLARYADRLWKQIEAQSAALLVASTLLGLLVHAFKRLEHTVAHGAGSISAVLPRVKWLERRFHGIEHRVKTLEREVGHGIGEDVLPRIKSLERRLGNVVSNTIPAIRSDVATAEGEVTELEHYIADNIPIPGTKAFIGAIVAAIGAFGFGGLFCNGLKSLLGKRGCGAWSGLESLLSLFVDVLLIGSICEVIPYLEEGFSTIAAPMISTISAAGAGLCSPSSQAPPALPPSLVQASLPSNPGFTLNLP